MTGNSTLIDITEVAKGFLDCYEAWITQAAWDEVIRLSDEAKRNGMTERSRLREVIWTLYYLSQAELPGTTELHFNVFVKDNPGSHRSVGLKAIFHPAVRRKRSVTILLQNEKA